MEENLNEIINWSSLSRIITNGDRNCIRTKKIPKKHWAALDQLFLTDIPQWWENRKKILHSK
jgi:hypothetical protein